MSEPVPAVLPADVAARLSEFARTCKAAARAVSLYPGGHPAITTSLSRLAQATSRLTEQGPFEIQVHAEELLVDQARMPKADSGVGELAALLHRHLIGGLTLNAGADAESWRTLLLLLARSPEDVRADGGIAHLWTTAGGPSIDIREIDYTEVLRERQGLAATIESIIAASMAGPAFDLDEAGMRALREIVGDGAKLQQLFERLEATASAAPQGVELQTQAFLNLVRGLVEYVATQNPRELDSMFEQLAQGARHLSVEAMIALLAERSKPEAMAGSVNVVSALIENMNDASVAGFVADSVVAERGASERLAHAFRALVPEFDRQRQLLALARDEAETALSAEEDNFPELWERVEGMLTSYTDARYVSDDYARELSHARTQPVDVERTSDDPPERVAGWLATVSDSALRNLDRDLLSDLLTIEADPLRWRDIADTVIAHADDLIRVGYVPQAADLVEKLIEQGGAQAGRQPHASASLERFGRGSLMKHLPAFLRGADDATYARLETLCHTIGPSVIVPLAEGLAAEQDARARRRLRDILVGFGPRGADSIRPLMNATNWEVRRTAAFLLREFGGAEGLKELVPLLSDAEPLVQREAVQGLVLNGSREASAILLKSVMAARGRTRETLMKEVLSIRDERAAPLFAFVLRELDPRALPEVYSTAIDALATAGSDEAVAALKAALHRGQWWTPFSNRRFRAAAAQSLKRIGTPAALDVLSDASKSGAAGVRSAARAELSQH
jgi:HEAT repeats/PBS lyase HEAT-like repeat